MDILSHFQFPRAIGIAIDDLGWLNGSSQKLSGGPSRLGLKRNLDLNDYFPIVEIAKEVGIRLQGFFVLMEMDRLNTCAKYPTTTPNRDAFDNTLNISKKQIDIMNYVKKNAAYLEFGIHGVGHEYWESSQRTRAEWYNIEHKKPWPKQELEGHINCFKEIMTQYGLYERNKNSFPESFSPCAYGFHWNPNGEFSTGKLMADMEVKYAHTSFSKISYIKPPGLGKGGYDHGLLVLDRKLYGNKWYELSKIPVLPDEGPSANIIETHWPNWLAQDEVFQKEVSENWISYLKSIKNGSGYYLAKNTEQLYSQWLYKKYTKVNQLGKNEIIIDNTMMIDKAYQFSDLGNMVLMIPLKLDQHISEAFLDNEKIPVYYKENNFGFLYLSPLKQRKYRLKYKIGKKPLSNCISNVGTCNVYRVKQLSDRIEIYLKVYGTQEIKIRLSSQPDIIYSKNPNLKIMNNKYSKGKNKITIYGRNIQGETGKIIIKLKQTQKNNNVIES